MALHIGVDIGGTTIEAGLVDNKGRVLDTVSIKTEAAKGSKVIIQNIMESISQVYDKRVTSIGIGCAGGNVDMKKGIIHSAVNIPFKELQITKMVTRKFSKPCRLDNDANCFTYGEALFGAGKKYSTVIGITLGTGFGTGIVIHKKIFHGRNNAAEIGHMTINFDGPRNCTCHNNGCLESYLGEKNIVKLANSKGINCTSALELYNKALDGNEKAKKVWIEVGFLLGVGLVNIIHALDPDVIILGGQISKAWKFFIRAAEKTIKERCLFEPPPITKAKLGKKTPIVGAALL